MEKHVYMHGVGYGKSIWYDPKEQEVILGKILASGALLSMRLQGRKSNDGFSGLDYVSLCDYDKKDQYNTGRKKYNTYQQYIINSLSLVFPKDKIEVIEPILVKNCTLSLQGYAYMKYLGEQTHARYSDLPDEVQVKDSVSLENMTALTFPTRTFLDNYFFRRKTTKVERLKEEIEELYSLLKYFGYDVKIYDIETFKEMNEENIESLVLKR